jgi:hypothetical protein
MNANKIVYLMEKEIMTTCEENLNTDGSVFNVIYTWKGIKMIYIYILKENCKKTNKHICRETYDYKL